MKNFIGFTVGLHTSAGFLSAEFNRAAGDRVAINAASARNMGQLKNVGTAWVSLSEFNERPQDAYDDIVEARWAFSKLGIEISGDS